MNFTIKAIVAKILSLSQSSRWFNPLVKVVIATLLGFVLYLELTSKDNLPQLWQTFLVQLSGSNVIWVLLAFALMPLNWMAETEKWYKFVARFQYFPRWKALLAVFTGVSFSLFTPNRVGEYGGRLLYVHPENQWKAIVANLIGNFCQYMVLLGMGAIGSAWILSHLEIVEPKTGFAIVFLAAFGLIIMMWIYFQLDKVITWIKKNLPQLKKIPYINHIRIDLFLSFNQRERVEILIWALIRYFIYSLQYILLLRFFGIQPGIIPGFAGVFSLYLLQTSLPLPPLTGLVARGNLAVFLWGYFGANELAALAATFSLWVINLVIPALIGTISLFYVNISKSISCSNEPTPNLTKVAPPPGSLLDIAKSQRRSN